MTYPLYTAGIAISGCMAYLFSFPHISRHLEQLDNVRHRDRNALIANSLFITHTIFALALLMVLTISVGNIILNIPDVAPRIVRAVKWTETQICDGSQRLVAGAVISSVLAPILAAIASSLDVFKTPKSISMALVALSIWSLAMSVPARFIPNRV